MTLQPFRRAALMISFLAAITTSSVKPGTKVELCSIARISSRLTRTNFSVGWLSLLALARAMPTFACAHVVLPEAGRPRQIIKVVIDIITFVLPLYDSKSIASSIAVAKSSKKSVSISIFSTIQFKNLILPPCRVDSKCVADRLPATTSHQLTYRQECRKAHLAPAFHHSEKPTGPSDSAPRKQIPFDYKIPCS